MIFVFGAILKTSQTFLEVEKCEKTKLCAAAAEISKIIE